VAPRPIFSRRWIVETGLQGDSQTILVPDGHEYIVKVVTFYSSPVAETVRGFFMDALLNTTLFACAAAVRLSTDPAQPAWYGYYGAFCFPSGTAFKWHVSAGLNDGADVYAGGYDLVG